MLTPINSLLSIRKSLQWTCNSADNNWLYSGIWKLGCSFDCLAGIKIYYNLVRLHHPLVMRAIRLFHWAFGRELLILKKSWTVIVVQSLHMISKTLECRFYFHWKVLIGFGDHRWKHQLLINLTSSFCWHPLILCYINFCYLTKKEHKWNLPNCN